MTKLFDIRIRTYYLFKLRIRSFIAYAKKILLIKDYLTENYWIKFIEEINGSQFADKGTNLYYLRNKSILLKRLGNNAGRDFLLIDESSYEDYINFTDKHPKFVAKIKDGTGGKGIYVIYTNRYKNNLDKLYAELIANNALLLEEFIVQASFLNNINPNSVAAIRICTLNISGTVEIVSAPLLRIGLNNDDINSKNMFMLRIDSDTGKVYGPSLVLEDSGNRYIDSSVHPYNSICLENYVIPDFKAIIETAKEAAKLMPEINYIGWDIAITSGGPVIIEGNGAPYSYQDEQDIYLYENDNKEGVKQYYERLRKYFEFRKRENIKEIEAINSKLFIEDVDFNREKVDYVIILGSQNCGYRAQKAIEMFYGDNIVFVPTGANKHNGKYEYEIIKEYLVNAGVNDKNILTEQKALNTRENLKYSFELIKKDNNVSYKKLNIAIVTAGFHSMRVYNLVKQYMKKYNIKLVCAYGKYTAKDNWYKTFKGYNIIMDEMKKV